MPFGLLAKNHFTHQRVLSVMPVINSNSLQAPQPAANLDTAMSRFAKRFHLTCAIVASFTCVLWSLIVGLVVFYGRTRTPRFDLAKAIFFLIPALVMGAGALMEFRFYSDERKAATSNGANASRSRDTDQREVKSTGLVLVTTWPRALAAIAFTLLILTQGLRSFLSMKPYSVMYSGSLPNRAVGLINIAIYGVLLWVGVNVAFGTSRKDERALIFTLCVFPILAPVGVLLPTATVYLRFVQTLLELTALLASMSILLSLPKDRQDKPREEDRA
jgi:hypothetical protein